MADRHSDVIAEVIFGAEFNCFQTPIHCTRYPENHRADVLNNFSLSKEGLSGWALGPQG